MNFDKQSNGRRIETDSKWYRSCNSRTGLTDRYLKNRSVEYWRPATALTVVRRLKDSISEIGHFMSTDRLELNTEKTELRLVGFRHLAYFGCFFTSLQPGVDVRLPGVTMASD